MLDSKRRGIVLVISSPSGGLPAGVAPADASLGPPLPNPVPRPSALTFSFLAGSLQGPLPAWHCFNF